MIFRLAALASTILFSSLFAQGTVPKGPKKKDAVPDGYKKDDLRGFTLYFSNEVLEQDKNSKLERKPLEALEKELIIVENVLPADKIKSLKSVPIWVEWDERIAMANGRAGGALAVFYGGHQSNLLGGDKSPLKSNSVTILSLKSLTREHQPKTDSGRCVTLHELAHAFHYRVVGDNNPVVKSTFRQAMERKLYDPALYAATNEHEYFAELSCAYLEKLDYFPRNREELKKHDPKGYELMEKHWGRLAPAKSTATAKDPKLPSANGDGKFSLDTTLDRVKFGSTMSGTLPERADWTGRPFLVYMFPARSGRAVALFSKLNSLQTELQDFGLISVAAETSEAPAEVIKDLARQREAIFPIVQDDTIGPTETFSLPHTLLFDHTGKCIFRGALLDAEPYVRIAIGKALLAKLKKNEFDKTSQPVVDLIAQGAPMSVVFAKLAQQLKTVSKAMADELNEIQEVLLAGGKNVLEECKEKSKTDPLGAFFLSERLPLAYRGSALEKPTFEFVNKMKGNVKVEPELRARPSLDALKKIETQLAGREMSFDPRSPDFKANNSVLLKQLQDAVQKMVKQFPNARATEDANRLAERWDVKLK